MSKKESKVDKKTKRMLAQVFIQMEESNLPWVIQCYEEDDSDFLARVDNDAEEYLQEIERKADLKTVENEDVEDE